MSERIEPFFTEVQLEIGPSTMQDYPYLLALISFDLFTATERFAWLVMAKESGKATCMNNLLRLLHALTCTN